jgi:hypothetical protein
LGLGVHDVEAAASVHQYLGELCATDDGFENKRVLARLWNVIRVVIMIEGDGRPGPIEEGWHG